jgi:hypothetical protein
MLGKSFIGINKLVIVLVCFYEHFCHECSYHECYGTGMNTVCAPRRLIDAFTAYHNNGKDMIQIQ